MAYLLIIMHEKYTGIWHHPCCYASALAATKRKDKNEKRIVITYTSW